MKTTVACLALALSIALFAAFPASAAASDRVAGYYDMVTGGFNEAMSIELRTDGTYVLHHQLFMCVIQPDGTMPMHYGEERGTWSLTGDLVSLEAKSRSQDFTTDSVFVPCWTQKMRVQYHWFRRYLVCVGAPGITLRRVGSSARPDGFGVDWKVDPLPATPVPSHHP